MKGAPVVALLVLAVLVKYPSLVAARLLDEDETPNLNGVQSDLLDRTWREMEEQLVGFNK